MSSCTVRSSFSNGRGSPCFMPRSVDDLPASPVPTRTAFTLRETEELCLSSCS